MSASSAPEPDFEALAPPAGENLSPPTPVEAELELLIRARYPLLSIVSAEEDRVMESLASIAERSSKIVKQWSINSGLCRYRRSVKGAGEGKKGTKDPILALREIEVEKGEPTIFVLKDFHRFMDEAPVVRGLRDLAATLRDSYSTVVLLSPVVMAPPELEKDLTIVDYPLPDRPEIARLLDEIAADIRSNANLSMDASPESRQPLIEAAIGLTKHEAENAFAKVLLRHGRLGAAEAPDIYEEKKQIVRKSGLLEYIDAAETIEDIGGLESLKEWLKKRSGTFHPAAREFGLPIPKGLLLLGIQGCGKSLAAKAVSRYWKMPLLRMDMGRLFGPKVGSSEMNVRQAILLAETIAPAILWIDEIDKGFAGLKSSGESDSGTAARVFASLITWMQEKRAPVFVIATANNVESLPPELLRQGRFDEIFFVDLPTTGERTEIFRVHLRKRLRKIYDARIADSGRFESFDQFVESFYDPKGLAEAAVAPGPANAEGAPAFVFSGAEIEQAIVSALYEAFYEKKLLDRSMILRAMRETSPLSKVMAEELGRRRAWARDRARRASPPESAEAPALPRPPS